MKYAKLGKTSLQASKIILGTWQAGKDMWAGIDDKETTRAIRGAIDLGITTIDTAIIYGNGHSEQIIGEALKDLSREKYQIATKVFANNLKYKQVLIECDKSLKNLQMDYIDLYQIHWPSGSFDSEVIPIKETIDALNHLKSTGKIKHIGVSNFSKDQIIEALEYGEIVSNQPPYSLIWRPYDRQTNPYCRDNNISILAYSPLAQGILTGKFKAGHVFVAGDHRTGNKFMHSDVFPKVSELLTEMQQYADKYKTSLGNIALNWVISQPNTFAIVGARNFTQVQENAKACNFSLSTDELVALDTLSEKVTKHMDQTGKMWDW